jgi:deazaflavin-dependent oxidoreductase (nitroreductase family)
MQDSAPRVLRPGAFFRARLWRMTSRNSIAEAAEAAREVDLTTFGRRTGRPSRRTMWITTDSDGRLFVRSGIGPGRDWPQNLLANQRAVLHVDRQDIPVRARHVDDRAELRASSDAVKRKYGRDIPSSNVGEPLTLAEQATFELIPEQLL